MLVYSAEYKQYWEYEMAVLRIVKLGDVDAKVLRLKAGEVTDFRAHGIEILVNHMWDTLNATDDGVGLAAPQVGVSVRVIIVKTKGYQQEMINPVIVKRDQRLKIAEEGCLSVPGFDKKVRRSPSIEVRFTTLEGFELLVKLSGLEARVVQHEIDHLNGITIKDK